MFASGSKVDVRLRPDSIENEDTVLDWIAHQAFVRRLKHSTIKGKVGHINSAHAIFVGTGAIALYKIATSLNGAR